MLNLRKSIQLLTVLPIPLSGLLTGDLGQFFPTQDSINILAAQEMSLENRYSNSFVNEVFKDNILLNLAYMRGEDINPKKVNWDAIRSPFTYEFELGSGKVFAFHDDVSEKYRTLLVKHTNAHFNATEGFKTDGYLYGDGVCHLASLLYMAAKNAGLEAETPTNHDFMPIPDIPREYGVSIYSNPFAKGSNTQQNLYITNNKTKPITFKFEYRDEKVKVSIIELN